MNYKKTNDSPIKDVLLKFMESYRHRSKLKQSRIESLWFKVMGTTVAKYTTRLKYRNNILYVYLESSPLKNELVYGRDKIKRNINEELGEEEVKDVIIL